MRNGERMLSVSDLTVFAGMLRSVVAQEANRMLDKIRVGINKAYQEIIDRDGYVSAEKVSNDIENLSEQIESMENFICQAI